MLRVMVVLYLGSGLLQLVEPLEELGERFELIMLVSLILYSLVYLANMIPVIF